ncbi:MAG: restriction endonuclease subunit R, partial [Candidatus Cloacimonetes bacterium]|nr:restriction endonuclease subunit R [Candidatus Cloacimonadota bacterium]
MLTAIKTAIDAIRKNKQIFSFDEIRTKQEIILGVLHALGWNVFNTDEVEPEYEVSRRRVDYVLRVNKVNECFIEVKKV